MVHNLGQPGISDARLGDRNGPLEEDPGADDHGVPWAADHEDQGLLQAADASEASQGVQTGKIEEPHLAGNGQGERREPRRKVISTRLFWRTHLGTTYPSIVILVQHSD